MKNLLAFCCVVGLTAAGTSAQVPTFKMWVTEVYEVNPDGTYTARCGPYCPTQELLPGIALSGDLIQIEVEVEGWDASTDSGVCHPEGEACSVSAQDCALSHCSGLHSSAPCTNDSDCVSPDTCDPDNCRKSPILAAFQWAMDPSTFSNDLGPGLALAELACTTDRDCACPFTERPGDFNDCSDWALFGFCTCAEASCVENVCDPRAVAYIDYRVEGNFVFAGCQTPPWITLDIPEYQFGASCTDVNGGVPEELLRCSAGARPICNTDADCPSGSCELVRTSPYYLGTLILVATGEACGLLTLDLLEDSTFLIDNIGSKLPTPIIEPLRIDIGVSQPCDDGDPCTENDATCGGTCAGTPIRCAPGEWCLGGICTDCTFDQLIDATWADDGPPADDPFDRPGNCAIDARQPHSINDVTAIEGWDRLVLTFSCDPTRLATTLEPARFLVQTDSAEVSPPAIASGGVVANAVDRTITIPLGHRISPGTYTCVTHTDSANQWCAGFLPADASQDGLSTAADINALIHAINHVPGHALPIYATDMDRSGTTNGQDILRLIDLLNGASDFDPWLAQGLPPCPSLDFER